MSAREGLYVFHGVLAGILQESTDDVERLVVGKVPCWFTLQILLVQELCRVSHGVSIHENICIIHEKRRS